jgi:hypothetical protein
MPRNLIQPGYYFGTVTDHGYGPKDGEEGTPYLAVKFDLEDMGNHEPAGSITAYLYLTDKSIEQTAKKLRAIGYAGTDGNELSDGTRMRGMRCQVQVTQEAYNGEFRNKVGWINPEDYEPGGVIKGEASAKVNAKRLSTLLKTLPATDKRGDKVPF